MNKKAIFVIAFNKFKDEEFFVSKSVLENAGWQVLIASTELGMASGVDGGEVKIDFLIDNIKVDDFDVIIFIGGPGMVKNVGNMEMHKIIQEVMAKNKIIGAICIAPLVLAKSGILKNKKATVWSSDLDDRAVEILKNLGVIYENKNVVVDGNIITANGPEAAQKFGEKILEIIEG
jgi:protease I